MQEPIAPPLVDVYDLADALGLPAAWLKAEAKAQRIPYVQVGRKPMFGVIAVRDALLERATENVEASVTV